MNINDRIKELEKTIEELKSKVADLSLHTEEKNTTPISIVGGNRERGLIRPVDAKTGATEIFGGAVVWNDSELKVPPLDEEPPLPTKGYNKHSHSRYSGGALIKDMLEIIEYVWETITNKDCQQYWITEPKIATDKNSKGEVVDRIGQLDLVFNPDTLKWGSSAFEIDVNKCYLVQRDDNGNILLDENGKEMKSPLLNADITKTCIIWDKDAKVWRFYAVYASGI